jgi:hypothetical protein
MLYLPPRIWIMNTRVACTVVLLLAPLGGGVATWAFGDEYGQLPHGEGFRNVRDFGAKGDGVTDDTPAFIRALEVGRGGKGTREKTPANVYVPSGTYLLSDTLIVYRATLLAGDADDPPTLVLQKNAPGFGDPAKPKPLIVTYGAYDTDPADRQWAIRTDQVGGSTNNTFLITVRHLNLKIEAGNPGAWGIFWLVAQQTALRNVSIDAGAGQGCLKSFWWGGGGVMSHLKLVGGEYGWHVQQTSQWAARSVELSGQRKASLWLDGVWNFALLDFRFRHTAPMQVQGGNVSLVASSFEDIAGGSAIENRGGSLVLAGVETQGVREVVKGALPGSASGKTTVKLWAAGSAMVNGTELAGTAHDLSNVADVVPREWPSPLYPLPGRGTRSVKSFGAAGDGKADDTAALQRAIAECREVFFPAGTYVVSDTLRLRPDSRLFGEVWSIIKLRGDAAGYQESASRKALLDVPADPAATVTLCHLFFQMETPGGLWMDWRAGEKSMLLDTLCIPTSTKQELLWRISGPGGGFFENSWNPGVGLDGLEISSTGRKWMYGVQQEHYTRTAAILHGCENLALLVFQFEGSAAPYVRMENCRNVSIFQGIAGHWSGAPGPLFDVVGGRDLALLNSAICNNQHVITEQPNGWKAGPSHPRSRELAGQTVWIKR